MLYTIIITDENGEQTQAQTQALNAKQAHEQAQTQRTAETDTIRVYPNTDTVYGVMRGALMAAKRAAEKAESGQGTETQRRISAELRAANAKAGAGGAEQLGEAYIFDLIARMSADSQATFSDAYTGIYNALADGITDVNEQYHAAYLSINAGFMAQRSATEKETSAEYIEEGGGTLVAISDYIGRIIRNGERYTPNDSATMDTETAEQLGMHLSAAMMLLTPRQKQIARLIGLGNSQAQTAQKMNIKNKATVNEHLTRIRKIILDYFTDNAAEFLYLIRSAEVKAAKVDRHTENGIQKRKAHNAEYCKAYRERKRAEQRAIQECFRNKQA